MIERLFLPDRFMGMKLPIDRVRGRSLDCLRDLAHSSRASRLESLNLKPQHMNADEASARLTRFGSPESQVRMQLCEFSIGSRESSASHSGRARAYARTRLPELHVFALKITDSLPFRETPCSKSARIPCARMRFGFSARASFFRWRWTISLRARTGKIGRRAAWSATGFATDAAPHSP